MGNFDFRPKSHMTGQILDDVIIFIYDVIKNPTKMIIYKKSDNY